MPQKLARGGCAASSRNRLRRRGYTVRWGPGAESSAGSSRARREVHRSEPRCSQPNAESVSKREFMTLAASPIRLTRRGDPIHSKDEKGLQFREVRRLFPNSQIARIATRATRSMGAMAGSETRRETGRRTGRQEAATISTRRRRDGDAATPRREAATMGGLPFDLADMRRILEPGRVTPYHAERAQMRGQSMLGAARLAAIEPYGFAGLFVVAAFGGEPTSSASASPDTAAVGRRQWVRLRRGCFAPSRANVAADAAGGTDFHARWVRLRHTPCSVHWARDGMTARPRRKVRGEMTRRRRNERA
jgi:hypothetical protein